MISARSAADTPATRLAQRVLLIGWDGADWKLINPLLESGQMPNLARLIERGAMGNIASLTPMLSPILWTSIATGKHADKHQILGFAEPDGAGGGIRPVSSTSRRCKALWNILSQRGLRAGVVNWFASHPAEAINGFVVTDRFPQAVGRPDQPWPPVAGSIHPAELLNDACRQRIHPAQTTQAQVKAFVPRVAELDPRKEEPLQHLRAMLAQCATVQRVTTWLMQERPWDFLGVYFDAIDRFAHVFMEYHPPRMVHVAQREFELYHGVMNACYRFHDQMLGRLVQLAGDDATIILLSDHGFHSDHLRPAGSSKIREGRPVAWHRPYGILTIAGPHIRPDQRVYGASLLDIAPTVLTLLGLPVGRDMDGRPLTQIFDEARQPVPVEWIDSHESQPARTDATNVADTAASQEDPWVVQQQLRQLVALGYIESDDTEALTLDRMRNLGQVYAATGRPALAIREYQQVLERKPDDRACRVAIAWLQLQLGQLDDAEAAATALLADGSDAPFANLFMGMVRFRRGDPEAALTYLRRAEEMQPAAADLQVQIGQVLLVRRRWTEARQSFERALAIDPDSAEAHDGLGVALRWLKQPDEAVLAHMRSIALLHYRPQTHIHLGMALAESGQFDWAVRALEVASEQDPQNPLPQRCLARLYRRAFNDPQRAAQHRRQAQTLASARRRVVAEGH